MTSVAIVLILLLAAPAAAQVQSVPADPPIVTAENDNWYRLGQPMYFGGEQYLPSGPTIFFNGNTMVRTGHFNGVPVYEDSTREPFSVLYVPIGNRLMQPYVRRTSPIPAPASGIPEAVGTTGRIGRISPDSTVSTTGIVPAAPRPGAVGITSARRPESNDGIWIEYRGARWVSAGQATRLTDEFQQSGQHRGFPVYTRRGEPDGQIYLPTSANVVAPFRRR